jgi:maltose/moltooligosaccharide transporter
MLEKAGVANTAPEGHIPDTVRYAFYAGGVVLLGAIAWTVFSTREYPPDALADWDEAPTPGRRGGNVRLLRIVAVAATLLGAGIAFAVWSNGLDKALYVLAGLFAGFGLAFLLRTFLSADNAFTRIVDDMRDMPGTMARLAVVQFFSWFALFAMWIYTTAAVTEVHFGSTDTASAAYNAGANWVGVLFAAYNGFAAIAAIVIPWMVRRIGLRGSHLVNSVLGGLGLLSIAWIRDPHWLLLSMVGVGFAWASILSLPYALLSGAVPAKKMGVYMGIFNFFIVIPQLVAASLLGFLLKAFLGGHPVDALAIGGASMIAAGFCVLLVRAPSTRAA